MYLWIFRHLPGPRWVRILISAAALAGAVFLLFDVVFPWLAGATNLTDVTVG
jgi:hypothetical protein